MKKLVSVLLCAVLVLSLCCGAVSAAGTDYLEAAGKVDVKSGTAVLVLTTARPMTNAKVSVTYDSEALSCGQEDVAVSGTVHSHDAEEPGTVRFGTAVSTADTMAAGETLAVITFGFGGKSLDTEVTVTVENWNGTVGISETQTVKLTTNRFVDVPADSWFAEAVNCMAADGYLNGIDATHFGPSLAMNRASFVTVLGRIDGNADTQTQTPFADVPVDSFYSGHVAWAVENGITTGIDATHFNPTGSINRAQMVTFLYRYAKYTGMDVTVGEPMEILGDYLDGEAVCAIEWAAEPFAWAVQNGIINGMDGALNPNGTANRAQVAVMLYRFFY